MHRITRTFFRLGRMLLAAALVLIGMSSALPAAAAPRVVSASVGAQTGALTAGTPGSASYVVTVTKGTTSSLTANLSVTGLPAGATGSFSPSSLSWSSSQSGSKTSTLTINTTAAAAPGATSFTVRAVRSGTPSDNATGSGSLTIRAVPTITFGAAPAPTYPGANFSASATTNSNGVLTYSAVSGPCAVVDAGLGSFSPTGAGTCVVQASTAATASFAAGSAQQSITIAAGSASSTAYDLYAKTGTLALPGSTSVNIYGYSATAGGAAGLPGPTLTFNAGDAAAITLHNVDLPSATSLMIAGLPIAPDTTGVGAGSSKTYTIPAGVLQPGTYLYEAGMTPNGPRQAAMGLFGALIVRPAGHPDWAYDANSAFDDEALLIYSEIDPAFNAAPSSYHLQDFTPKYLLINGKAYPQTSPIAAAAGHKLLLRQINAGLKQHSIGMLGQAQSVIAEDGSLLRYPYRVTAESLAAGQALDTLVSIPAGAPNGTRYPLYDAALSAAGPGGPNALGGALTFVEVSGTAPGGDTTGPAIGGLSLSPAFTDGTAAVAIAATVSDAASGGANVTAAEFHIDSTGGTAYPLSGSFGSISVAVGGSIGTALLAPLSAGGHTVYVRGQDAAGNWGPFSSASFTLDNAGPVVSAIALSPNPTNSSAVAIQATVSDATKGNSNVVAAEYTIDGGAAQPLAGSFGAPTVAATGSIPAATVAGLAPGAHTVAIRGQDAAGNWGAASATLTISRTGPTTSIQGMAPNPNNGAQVYNTVVNGVRVDATFTSASANIATGEMFLATRGADGSGIPMLATDSLFSSASKHAYGVIPLAQTQVLAQGTYTVFVHGKDAAGNWGADVTTTLTIDKTLPSASALLVAPNPTNGAATVTLTATGTDPLSGGIRSNIVAGEYFIGATDPGAGNATAMSAADGSFDSSAEGVRATVDVSSLAPGSYTVSVRVQDAAGNWSALGTTSLVVSYPPLYFSTRGNTNPPGVAGSADDADIYLWDGTYTRVWDASTHGVPSGANVDGVVRVDANHFYLSFADNVSISGLGTVQDEDIVYYNNGVWSVYFDGTAHGLGASGNLDIDAFDIVGGTIYFSTLGNTNPPGVAGSADDADIYAWNGSAYSRVWDASAHGVPSGANVDGLSVVDATHFYLSFADNATIAGLGATQDEDVLYYNNGAWSVYFDGTAHGLGASGNLDLDGIDVP